MDNAFALILDILSKKPQYEETDKKLLKELRTKFRNKSLKSSNIKKEFDQALKVGHDLDVLRIIPITDRKQRSNSQRRRNIHKKRNRRQSRGRERSRTIL